MRNDRRNRRLMTQNGLSNEQADDNVDFEEALDEYVASDGPPMKTQVSTAAETAAETRKSAVPGDEQDGAKPSSVGKILSVIGVAVTLVGMFCLRGWFGTKTGTLFILRAFGPLTRKLTSLFVWKIEEWDEEPAGANKEALSKMAQPTSVSNKLRTSQDFEFDGHETSRSGWLKRTGKFAAILAACLLLVVGGYYGVTKFWPSKADNQIEIAQDENEGDTDLETSPTTNPDNDLLAPVNVPTIGYDPETPLPPIADSNSLSDNFSALSQNTMPLPPSGFDMANVTNNSPPTDPFAAQHMQTVNETPPIMPIEMPTEMTAASPGFPEPSETPPAPESPSTGLTGLTGLNSAITPADPFPSVASNHSAEPTVTSPETSPEPLVSLAPSVPLENPTTLANEFSSQLTALTPLQPSTGFAATSMSESPNVIDEQEPLPLVMPTSDGTLTPLTASTSLPEARPETLPEKPNALFAPAPSPPAFPVQSEMQAEKQSEPAPNFTPLPPSPVMAARSEAEVVPNFSIDNSTQTQLAPPINNAMQAIMQEPAPTIPNETFTDQISAPTLAPTLATAQRAEKFVAMTEPFAVPKSDDLESNPLISLLPSASAQGNASLSSSPLPVYAEPNPKYQEEAHTASLLNNATPTNIAAPGDRAVPFQNAIQQELKYSPRTTEEYVVQQNDTYMGISEQKYGTNLLFRALAVHNRLKGAEWSPVPGTVIEIPPADFLQKQYAELLSRMRRPAQRTAQEIASLKASAVPYIVREGDTVFTIATNVLRDTARWQEILEVNADTFSDPRDLRPGMRILLPSAYTSQNLPGTGR